MKSSARALAAMASGFVLLAAALPAAAQNADACPAGQVFSVVRMSTIKPTGSMDGFNEAVRDHVKWYRDHGYTTNDIASHPVLETKDQGQTGTVSKTQVFSIHKNDPHVPRDKYDAAWSAYVAKYRANSDITNEMFVCLPK